MKQISKNLDKGELRDIFLRVIEELEIFLDLESLPKNIQIEFGNFTSDINDKNILDIGVSRRFFENKLNIIISRNFQKFLPIILLREAYLTFLPYYLTKNEAIKIFINQIVDLNLQDLKIIEEWKKNTSKKYVNYEFIESYSRIKDFFELQIKEGQTDTIIEFFFEYIRNNLSIFEKNKKNLYDTIFKNFVYKTSKSMNNDEIIETIKILIKIFYKEKTYRALIDYKNYFLEYKEQNLIKTNLSLREFIRNLRWIKNFTYIGPSYHVNWRLIGIEVFFSIFEFNPNLSKHQINDFIKHLPFFYQSSSSENNFSIKTHGWFVIPKVYQNDLMKFLRNLKNSGYLSEDLFLNEDENKNILNLNYFREKFHQKKGIVDISHRAYDPSYEISFKHEYHKPEKEVPLSIIDFLILDRVRYYSVTGFSFKQRNKALRSLKSDLTYEIINQKKILNDLKNNVRKIRESEVIISNFVNFIEKNKNFGFFFILETLKDLLNVVDKIIEFVKKKKVKSLHELRESILKHKLSQILSQNLEIKNRIIKNIIFKDLFPDYFMKREIFLNKKRRYELFKDYLSSCEDLRIYNMDSILKIIQNENLINRIFLTKEEKIEKSYQKSLILDFDKNDLKQKLNHYVNSQPPFIKPMLISTISVGTFAKYYLHIVTRKNDKTMEQWNYLKKYFPRILTNSGKDLFLDAELISKHIWLHNITSHEKLLLISILQNIFGDDLVSLRRYFFDGFFQSFSRKDFYDFDKKEFFYTKDLFEQYLKYTKTIFGERIQKFEVFKTEKESLFWIQDKKNMEILIEEIKDRLSRENLEFDIRLFEQLKIFHKNLVFNLIDDDKFSDSKEKEFFNQYVKHIYFIPNYQKFGYSHYTFYFNPSDLNEIDFKLLLTNSFLNIKYPGYVDKSKSLFINYIFPYRNPNVSYLNWLTKSKKVINENCVFYIKKIYQLFHFDFNVSPKGWDLNPNRFKSFYENILYNPKYKLKPSLIKEYKIGNLNSSDIFSHDSIQYKTLENLYSYYKKDLKSILSLRNEEEIKNIQYLIKNELIIPYIDLKNLGLIEELTIILLDIKKDLITQLIEIISFFNFGFIYEIEGTYYINGLKEEKKFENGLLIQLKLPDCDLGEFVQQFDQLFQYLDIDKYLILNDLLEGLPLMRNIYGNLDFLELYNPFQNLEWNEKDNIWMNWKLFDENFNFIYPELIKEK